MPDPFRDVRIAPSNILSFFDKETIGAKALDSQGFISILQQAIFQHNFAAEKTPGQAVIDLAQAMPKYSMEEWRQIVSGGIGPRSARPQDYVLRLHRGHVHMFLKREFAAPPRSIRAVVYTKQAYLVDPDVLGDLQERQRIEGTECTHVLVAVLASCVDSFVSPYRFVANLAGGNLDYEESKMKYAGLVSLAKQVKEFDDNWAVVGD